MATERAKIVVIDGESPFHAGEREREGEKDQGERFRLNRMGKGRKKERERRQTNGRRFPKIILFSTIFSFLNEKSKTTERKGEGKKGKGKKCRRISASSFNVDF